MGELLRANLEKDVSGLTISAADAGSAAGSCIGAAVNCCRCIGERTLSVSSLACREKGPGGGMDTRTRSTPAGPESG